MNKKQISYSILVSFILAVSPSGLILATSAATSSTFYYSPQSIVVGTATPSSGNTPLCFSANTAINNITCYAPNFISTAYNFPSTLSGAGQTIVIVDAFGSPTIVSDLVTFDSTFGISPPPSFTVICGTGGCPTFSPANFPHDEFGWAVETSLDVEYAHAMAPGANIVLDVASSNSGNAINKAESTAISLYPGSVMSQSFGIPEYLITANNGQVLQAEQNYAAATAAGITLLASAGDSGATNGQAFANALFPSSDPHNLAIGGTQGFPYNATGTLQNCASGQTCTTGLSVFLGRCTVGIRPGYPGCTPTGYGGEQVWNEPQFDAATGGAPSLLFSSPSYQSGVTGFSARTTPDVSYNAAVNGGVLVFASFTGIPHWYIVGGTSAGSPQWASIFAIVNQQRSLNGKGPIGFANGAIYGLSASQKAADFHDITIGNNQLVGTPVGFTAVTGYDLASGWGTPNVANLVTDLS